MMSLVIVFCQGCQEYVNKDVVDNYNTRRNQIIELKQWYNSNVPAGKFVEIEFDDDDHLFRFGIYSLDSTGNYILPGFLDWDLNTNSRSVKSEMTKIGWTQNTLDTLKRLLDNVKTVFL